MPRGLFGSFFFSSRRRHTRFDCDWSSDVCSSDLFEVRTTSGWRPLYVKGINLGVALPGHFPSDFPTDDSNYRSEEHTSELQSQSNLVCRLLLEKKKILRSCHYRPPPSPTPLLAYS